MLSLIVPCYPVLDLYSWEACHFLKESRKAETLGERVGGGI